MRRRLKDTEEAHEVVTIVRRIAVMVSAGLPASRVWEHVPGAGDLSPRALSIIRDCDDAARVGNDIAEAMRASVKHHFMMRYGGVVAVRGAPSGAAYASWLGLAATLTVAQECGAPLATCLTRLARSYDDNSSHRRAVRAALAAPRSTAGLMAVLPVASLGMSTLLGFNSVGILIGTGFGIACGVLGVILSLVAVLWSAGLVRRAEPRCHTPGLVLDLIALAVSGGGSLERSQMLVADTIERCDVEEHDELSRAQRSLDLATTAGIPASDLVHADADLVRAEKRSEGSRLAAQLAVRLMLPLGVCTLPAFVLLGVVPLILSIVSVVV
ncbi:type II secretion system F family protein [Lysinibacter sp. HNR]|uniref:type II secretion system F family protein n=1 Tax=Lysinibacter sp. HNR TaxID=3031408 RepID=UPI002435BF6F|nr:type II secretion system F family protein [Lysinibacter sp. HNR]WGD37080.1 type II secretion system F family protein [Lysinibacter sp. HNR]